jgi:hypothetical protein
MRRIVGTAAQLALTLAEGLALAVGAVLLWLVAMAVLPAEWQALVTLVFLAAVVTGLLGLVDMLFKND